jgi:hypothetical protein
MMQDFCLPHYIDPRAGVRYHQLEERLLAEGKIGTARAEPLIPDPKTEQAPMDGHSRSDQSHRTIQVRLGQPFPLQASGNGIEFRPKPHGRGCSVQPPVEDWFSHEKRPARIELDVIVGEDENIAACVNAAYGSCPRQAG